MGGRFRARSLAAKACRKKSRSTAGRSCVFKLRRRSIGQRLEALRGRGRAKKTSDRRTVSMHSLVVRRLRQHPCGWTWLRLVSLDCATPGASLGAKFDTPRPWNTLIPNLDEDASTLEHGAASYDPDIWSISILATDGGACGPGRRARSAPTPQLQCGAAHAVPVRSAARVHRVR